MLSIENPRRDPPCPCEIPQLKSGSDEGSSDKLEVADLFNSGLDDNNCPLPKFSIRDYVFNTRNNNDIRNNWPFSQKSLQLCLKHGVKDLLPPFQSLDAVRNPLHSQTITGSIPVDKENASNLNGEPSRSSDHFVFVDSENAGRAPKLAEHCFTINPSGSEGEKDFPSTTTSQSCSDIDSVPINKNPCLEIEANTLQKPSTAKPEVFIPPISSKTDSTNHPPGKKCRLIVKLSHIAHPSTREDTAVNNFMVSEAMASKVCPVCRTFSSSSNTTLNAHIDQCLSGESTTKCTADPKVIKPRIKSRKMKSMVDIYETAPHCTLEELDRRNGTSWASNSCLPAQEIEIHGDRSTQGLSSLNLQEIPSEGAVYIDANGTKLRILSKFTDPSLESKLMDDPRPKKLIEGDKGSKFLLIKKKKKKKKKKKTKKKNEIQKQHKILKRSSQGKKLSTSQSQRASEIKDGQDRNFSCADNYNKDKCSTQQLKALDQAKLNKPEMIKGWVCSKRTGPTKKVNGRDDHLHLGDCVDRNMLPEINQSSFGDSRIKKSGVTKIPTGNCASPRTGKRIDNLAREQHNGQGDHPSLRERMGLSSMDSQGCYDRKRSRVLPEFPEHGVKQLRNGGSCNGEISGSLLSERRVEIKSAPRLNGDHSVIGHKPFAGHHTLFSKSRRFSSLRKKLPSAGRTSAPNSRSHSKRTCSVVRKSRVPCTSESNEEGMVLGSGLDPQQNFMLNLTKELPRMQRTSPEELIDRTRVLKIRRSGGENMISRKEEAVSLNGSKSAPIANDHDAGENDGSFVLGSIFAQANDAMEAAAKNVNTCNADLDIELASDVAVGGTFMGFSRSFDPGFHRLSGPSDVQCDSQQCIETYKRNLFEAEVPTSSTEPILGGGREIFCADEVDENMIREGEVDPIPIPGPPGSFLPSPGHTDLEDLHGNSSLTSSRVHSSDEHRESVDHSSDSPISATSTISNSNLARSDSKSSERSSVGPPSLQDEMRTGFTSLVNVDPIVENSSPVATATAAGAGKLGLNELNVNTSVPEKGPFEYSNDQPCCCSRKEGSSRNIVLNYQDSQLLRRRTAASVLVPDGGKQMGSDLNRRFGSLRPELLSVSDRSPVLDEDALKSHTGKTSMRVSADPGVKFPIRNDYESVSPSASNAVLRLMGKNLMVFNKEENLPPQLRPCQSSSMIGHVNPQVVAVPGHFAETVRNGDDRELHCQFSHGPSFFDQVDSSNAVAQHLDMRWSNGLENQGNSGRPLMSHLAAPSMLPSRSAARGFTGSLMHEYTGGYYSPSQQLQPMNGLGASMTYHTDKVVETPSLGWRSADSKSNTIKEIIVIDDAPEREVDLTTGATDNQRRSEAMVSSGCISVSMSSSCDSPNLKSFYTSQQYKSAAYSGSVVDTGFRLLPPSGANSNAVRWNCIPEIRNALHSSFSTNPSSAKAPLRSELYNSSGF